ncbi:MAG: vWA domain-containing protein [Xanthobacteraceae bacterium]
MSSNVVSSISSRAHLEAFLARVDPVHGRLIFALDATASRQPTWDTAAHLQAQMFEAVAAIGGLDVQLVYFRGEGQCVASRWLSDAKALAAIMSTVTCAAGHTQIGKVLMHARKEHAREKVNALIVISDSCEETPYGLYARARELSGVPVFMFQEGDDPQIGMIYAEIAGLTGGAHCKFDAGAAQRLADLLKAVAAFAAGGVKALADQRSEAARLLLTQVKKEARR